jgi:hypothetical protein
VSDHICAALSVTGLTSVAELLPGLNTMAGMRTMMGFSLLKLSFNEAGSSPTFI